MQKQYKHIVLAGMLVCFFLSGFAQEEKKILHAGNKAYHSGKIMESASIYKKSLKEKPSYYKANFNLGDALYKTAALIKSGKMQTPNPQMTPDSAANLVFDQAAEQFEVVAKSVNNIDTAHKAWHNYGNAKLQQKNYEEAVRGYKKALRMNPKDDETRYNLAYAQRKLKEQQKNQNKDKQQNQDKQQQEKDKQKVNNPNDKDQQESQPPAMSKEQAEQMLNALKNSEKKNQDLHEKKGEGQKKNVEKDW
jgi:Ca-activated chloride channel family protein